MPIKALKMTTDKTIRQLKVLHKNHNCGYYSTLVIYSIKMPEKAIQVYWVA